MDAPLTPRHICFLLDDQTFEVNEFSESGFSLDASAAESWSIQSLGWGQDAHAHVDIRFEDGCTRYPIRFRVAGLRSHCVEVAVIEMPPELRFRLRHAARALRRTAERMGPASPKSQQSPDYGEPSSGRRLILSGSEPVLRETRLRREGISEVPSPPSDTILADGGHAESREAHQLVRLSPQFVGLLLILSSLIVAVSYVLAASAQ